MMYSNKDKITFFHAEKREKVNFRGHLKASILKDADLCHIGKGGKRKISCFDYKAQKQGVKYRTTMVMPYNKKVAAIKLFLHRMEKP